MTEEELENDYNSTIASTITSQSKLTCVVINSCDSNKEWSLNMPKREYIRCVCVSRCLLACMTSRRFLRVYGLAGTQKEIISFNGNAVCMSAYENQIFVCYANSGMSIEYSIYYVDCESKRPAEHGVLPVSEGAKLEWVGFSDEGKLLPFSNKKLKDGRLICSRFFYFRHFGSLTFCACHLEVLFWKLKLFFSKKNLNN